MQQHSLVRPSTALIHMGANAKLERIGERFSITRIVPICCATLLLISGCSGVGSDVLAGRNALQTGRANDAVGQLTRAADTDPNYKVPYQVRVGVTVYLGRAYLETGKDTEARQTLEKAVNLDKDDPFAHLYLGIAMLKTGARERGRKDIEEGLRAIDNTFEYIAEDRIYGSYSDRGMRIRKLIDRVQFLDGHSTWLGGGLCVSQASDAS